MKLTDRVEVTTHRGTVRLIVGDLPEPEVLVLSADHARSLARDLDDAAGVADLHNEETREALLEDATANEKGPDT